MVARPKHPVDKVRQLQRQLYIAAKRSQGRRFHALYDRIWRGAVLSEAWKRVRGNKGAAGIDGQTLAIIEQQGVEQFLKELGDILLGGDIGRNRCGDDTSPSFLAPLGADPVIGYAARDVGGCK